MKAAFTEEAKGAREATRQLIEQVREVGSAASGADSKMTLLYQALRLVEKRQEEQQVAVAATRMQEELSRQEIQVSATRLSLGVWLHKCVGNRLLLLGGRFRAYFCYICHDLTRKIIEREATEVSE